MMKIWLILLVLSFSSISFASGANVTPSVIFADLDVCKFKMNDLYGGEYQVDKEEVPALLFYSKVIKPNSKRPIEVDLKFRCVDPADAKTFADFSGGKMTDKGWVMSLDPDVEADTAMHNTVYVLKGKNWEGPAISQDVTNGEEQGRTRGAMVNDQVTFYYDAKKNAFCESQELARWYLAGVKSRMPDLQDGRCVVGPASVENK